MPNIKGQFLVKVLNIRNNTTVIVTDTRTHYSDNQNHILNIQDITIIKTGDTTFHIKT